MHLSEIYVAWPQKAILALRKIQDLVKKESHKNRLHYRAAEEEPLQFHSLTQSLLLLGTTFINVQPSTVWTRLKTYTALLYVFIITKSSSQMRILLNSTFIIVYRHLFLFLNTKSFTEKWKRPADKTKLHSSLLHQVFSHKHTASVLITTAPLCFADSKQCLENYNEVNPLMVQVHLLRLNKHHSEGQPRAAVWLIHTSTTASVFKTWWQPCLSCAKPTCTAFTMEYKDPGGLPRMTADVCDETNNLEWLGPLYTEESE